MERRKKGSSFEEMEEYLQKIEELAQEVMAAAFPEGPSWNTETCCLHALSNVFITPREVIVTADLPNVAPETVKVTAINEKHIEIIAKMKKKVNFNDLGICHRQGEFSFLHCQGHLQVDIDADKMQINCEDGILEVRFPRKNRQELE
ncbi:MAG: Hsp20/alpha crystallin family protein [Candidatus Bathyarchaeota archaeon]|nr:Hsp20/alpha crystallin family protein [Candidatus Bathyarchaeum tardum]WGM89656.1 MAG: Hsp20/alpha crystallin family protein [Candidatus Bathyarchaeum tardum]WNZ30242.1 MAG: Hsp20/alpha crystallin family protein [Candidatus Bathyarchaeota archaeon]